MEKYFDKNIKILIRSVSCRVSSHHARVKAGRWETLMGVQITERRWDKAGECGLGHGPSGNRPAEI